MDWLSVAKLIAPLAPALGGILGGFIPIPGGGLAGQALGNVIAKALGVPGTPDAVAGAIKTTDNDVLVAKLNAAAEEARAMWPAYAQAEQAYYKANADIAATVNATMRFELEHQHWFFTGWRPTAGWLFDFFSLVFGLVLTWAAIQAIGGNAVPINVLSGAWPLFAAFLGILAAMVGVYIIGRSQEKSKAIETAAVVPVPAKPTVRR